MLHRPGPIAVRHDAGDTETGFGLDIGRGGRVSWGHQKVCSYDYGKEASSLGSTLWGACPGSVSTPRRPPASSYFIVLGAIAPLRVTAHRVCTRDGVAGPRTADEGQTARLDLTTIFPTTRTPSRLLVVRSSDETNQHRKNNALQNHHRVVRRTFFVLTVIVRTNLLMTPEGPNMTTTNILSCRVRNDAVG